MNKCKLTECQGKPRCATCLAMDAAYPMQGDAAEAARLKALINAPELENFLRAVHIEAVHQVERWGTAHDRAKRPADWFWLVGYLGGKALHATVGGERDKALHHCVSTAAALYKLALLDQGHRRAHVPGPQRSGRAGRRAVSRRGAAMTPNVEVTGKAGTPGLSG